VPSLGNAFFPLSSPTDLDDLQIPQGLDVLPARKEVVDCICPLHVRADVDIIV